jgi:hypothetical protein
MGREREMLKQYSNNNGSVDDSFVIEREVRARRLHSSLVLVLVL